MVQVSQLHPQVLPEPPENKVNSLLQIILALSLPSRDLTTSENKLQFPWLYLCVSGWGQSLLFSSWVVELLLPPPTLLLLLQTWGVTGGMVYHVLCGLGEERMIVFDAGLVSLVVFAASYDSLEES